jgi:hypothetical protein
LDYACIFRTLLVRTHYISFYDTQTKTKAPVLLRKHTHRNTNNTYSIIPITRTVRSAATNNIRAHLRACSWSRNILNFNQRFLQTATSAFNNIL